MKPSEITISVNPGKSTLGDKTYSQQNKNKFLRQRVLHNEERTNSISLLSFIFKSEISSNGSIQKQLVPFRTGFASILILTGIFSFSGTLFSISIGISAFVCGILLALGLFSKIAMGVSSIIFLLYTILSIRSGNPDLFSFTLFFGCLSFFILGSSKYSLDSLLYQRIKRHMKNKKEMNDRNEFSYKAYKASKF